MVLVGFGSNRGSVIAADEWDAPIERMEVPPARDGSWEDVLNRVGPGNKLLLLDEARSIDEMKRERGHRAIGVVYHPHYEHLGNYVPTVFPGRYDAFLHFDQTRAIHPLHIKVVEDGEVPETFPSGM